MAAAAIAFPVRVSDCSIGWMTNSTTGECYPKLCGKWSCHVCGPRNVRRLAARLQAEALKFNRFITLTLTGEAAPTRATLRRMSAGWRKVRRVLARDYGLSDFFWVHEKQSRNGPRVHKHLVVRSEYIHQRKLSRLAAECGLGSVCWIEKIHGQLGMRSYLGKYLLKQNETLWPLHTRRVQHSLAREPRRTDDVWLFEPKPRSVWRRRPEPEPGLPEEYETGIPERRDPEFEFSRPPPAALASPVRPF